MILDTELNSAAQIPSELCVYGAVEAEKRGFGGIWKGESNSRDPMVLLSAMAARTSTIDLGTAIYHVYGRSPVTLGIQAATLNELSRGRLILGLGVGNPVIAGWHGSTFDRPLARMRDYIEIVRAVYSGERVPDIEGDFYSTSQGFRLAFKPPSDPLRIWVAGLGPQMARLAGRVSDGIMINMANATMIKDILRHFHEGAREAGRGLDELNVVSKIRVSLNEDADKARWALKKVLTFYSLQRGYSDVLRQMGWTEVVDRVQSTHKSEGFAAARRLIPDEMVDDVPMYAGSDLSGLPAKLAGHEAAGVTRCVIGYVPSDDSRQREEIDAFFALADFARQGSFA